MGRALGEEHHPGKLSHRRKALEEEGRYGWVALLKLIFDDAGRCGKVLWDEQGVYWTSPSPTQLFLMAPLHG